MITNPFRSTLQTSPSLVLEAEIRPTANQEMQAVLDQLGALGGKSIETLTPQEARKQPTPADAVKALLKKRGQSTAPEPVANVENKSIPGPGGEIAIRIYTPMGPGPFPVVLYIHGGGWVIADLDTYDSSPRALANVAMAVVVSTHYRQAPEHPFPASHEDVFTAYKWAREYAASFNGHANRIAVVGESAGGNMAAAISLMARERNVPLPLHQVLIYPVADTDMNSPSFQENANAKPLNKAMMGWFAKHEFKTPEDAKDPRIELVNANLRGMPSTTIITAEIDPLRSSGERLVEKLKAAGVDVEFKNYDSVTHEFFGMGAVLDEAKDAMTFAATKLMKAFNNASQREPARAQGNK
ncbi:MAG: alpha/beta hydrolase [Opitutaceae bacterium]|nr:alpha/beta hydrolase [Verrucomicrobiales bacterium]